MPLSTASAPWKVEAAVKAAAIARGLKDVKKLLFTVIPVLLVFELSGFS
jgi:hypothetical protein